MGLGPRLVLRVLGLVLGILRRVVGLPLGWLLGLVLVVSLVPCLLRLPDISRLRVSRLRVSQLRRSLLGHETVPGRQGRPESEHKGRYLHQRSLDRPGPDQLHPGRDDIPQHTDLFPCQEHGVFEPGEVQLWAHRQGDFHEAFQRRPGLFGRARQICPAFIRGSFIRGSFIRRSFFCGTGFQRRPQFERFPREKEIATQSCRMGVYE